MVSTKLKLGMKYELETTVKEGYTADFIGSGSVKVLSTPSMILLMEKVSRLCVEESLPPGYTTVGYKVEIVHLKPARLGSKIKVVSVLEKIEGKKLTFRVEAYRGKELIGKGVHKRFIVYKEEFLHEAES